MRLNKVIECLTILKQYGNASMSTGFAGTIEINIDPSDVEPDDLELLGKLGCLPGASGDEFELSL